MGILAERAIVELICAVFRIPPYRLSLFLGKILGRTGWFLVPSRRRLAVDNIRISLGDVLNGKDARKTARRSFESLGMNVAEFCKLPALTRENIGNFTSIEGEEILDEVVAGGKGAFILTGHIGSWDMLAAGLSLRGYPVALISKVSRSDTINHIWMKYRRDLGIGVFTGRGTMKESIGHLKKGGLVGFALDQNARRTEGVFVPFFGREACTITSLAILARRTGAVVIPAYSYREGDIHRIVVQKPLDHTDSADADVDIVERTAAYTRWIEEVVKLHPDQWTWLHDRWKTKPGS